MKVNCVKRILFNVTQIFLWKPVSLKFNFGLIEIVVVDLVVRLTMMNRETTTRKISRFV